jgi:Proton-conducting membrane transporter
MLMAGIGANLETDLQNIIAVSTLSQLGLIIIRIRIGAVKFRERESINFIFLCKSSKCWKSEKTALDVTWEYNELKNLHPLI